MKRNNAIRLLCLLWLIPMSCSRDADNSAVEPSLVETLMADSVALARGEALFVGSCANYCHARVSTETELSNPPLLLALESLGPDLELEASFLFDCEWEHGASDQELFDIVTAGIPDTRMPGFGSNFPEGDDDLWKLIAYLRVNQEECPLASDL